MINTGAIGRLSDSNLVRAAGVSGGFWDANLPLTNLADPSFIARPARCNDPNVLGASLFDVALAAPRAVNVVALLFHTLSANAKWRVRLARPAASGGNLATPDYISGWLPVWPRWASTAAMNWEDRDFWTGAPSGDDLDLYPRHAIWTPPYGAPMVVAGSVRVEIDDSTASFFDLGGAWVGSGWTPTCNFDRGRVLGLNPRDLVDEAPSGRLFTEARTPRRTLSLAWSGLTDADARRLFDAGARCGTSAPLLFVPDSGDVAAMARECWPATFADLPSPKFNFSGANDARAMLSEIVA